MAKAAKEPDQPTKQWWRDRDELGSRDDLVRNGTSPAACGPDVVFIAPARGPVEVFQPVQMVPDGKDGYRAEFMGFRGRSAMRSKDAFDLMLDACANCGAPRPFTALQIDAGRAYRDLSEWVASAGIKCSSTFDVRRGGGADRDFMDRYAQYSAMLGRCHQLIGFRSSLIVRRVRPSARGTRRTIIDRDLVDKVCIADKTITEALKAFGWSDSRKNIKTGRAALCAALDRMCEIL